MEKVSAILVIPNDCERERLKLPLMFSPILFKSILARIGERLSEIGVSEFCVIGAGDYEELTRRHLPQTLELTYISTEDGNAVDNILGFVANQRGKRVIVFTRPVLLLKSGAQKLAGFDTQAKSPVVYGAGSESGVYTISDGNILKDALLKADNFGAALIRAGGIYQTSEGGVLPVDSFAALHNIQDSYRMEIISEHIQNGVYILDKNSVYIDDSSEIMSGVSVLPGVIIKNNSFIGEECTVGPNTLIDNCNIGNRSKINASQLYESTVGCDTNIGPFAYMRPGCEVGDKVKIGDFVELKKAKVGNETKISHLTYVGDAELGSGVNMGCGTVTVNYDGIKKFKTIIEDNAFIGCNTNLVAPVKIGSGAYTAAGSTITQDVPANSLAIARSRQTVKTHWVKNGR